MLKLVQTINGYLSDYVLILLLVGTGLFFSIRTRFVQLRCFKEGWRRFLNSISLKGGRQESGLSSFQALATAVAAQVGTGNIVGACGAILIGGPGAIFWMWIIAFFGMATIYAEAVLAQETRVKTEDGVVHFTPTPTNGSPRCMKRSVPTATSPSIRRNCRPTRRWERWQPTPMIR